MNKTPQRKTETITIEYWDCGHPEHRHRSSVAAQNCINSGKNSTGNKAKPARTKAQLFIIMVRLFSGETQAKIAKEQGVHPTVIRQLVVKVLSQAKDEKYNTAQDRGYCVSFRSIKEIKDKNLEEYAILRLKRWLSDD